MRLGRFEARPNPALGEDIWEITEDDPGVEGGKRKLGEVPNRIRAETDLLRLNTRTVLGDESVAVSLSADPNP